VLRFHLWTSLMGAVLASIVFCITAFAVPLLFDGRASLVQAVTASVRAVFASPAARWCGRCCWGGGHRDHPFSAAPDVVAALSRLCQRSALS
jgi:hypothetical protein